MASANVPKFGNWENEDNVPYTVYFDKARKNRGGKMINPNDPQENPGMFRAVGPAPLSPNQTKPRIQPEPIVKGAVNPVRTENLNKRVVNEQSNGAHRHKPVRSGRPSAGSDQSFDRSPLHPRHQANESSNGGAPGRSHPRSSTHLGDESPDKGAAVPKFGAWNDGDPQSAENFTDIFNKVRDEKNAGHGNLSGTPKHPSYVIHNRPSNQPQKCGCFGW